MSHWVIQLYFTTNKKYISTKKNAVFYIDDTWSKNLIDLNDYGPKNNNCLRYVVVLLDHFSNKGWNAPLKKKIAQLI